MNYQDKISTIVEEALTEKTFNLEIITKIKALKDDFETVTASNESLKKRVEDLTKGNTALTVENNRLVTENTAYKSREDALATKEKGADKQAYELDFQTKRASEIKELFSIVFKNPVVKEQAFRNGNVPVFENGYTTTRTTNENETKETVTE